MTEPHSKLVEAVTRLDGGQRIKKAERSEPTIEVSEYHLIKSGISDNNVVRPEDLARSLGQKGHQHVVTKKLRYVRQKCRVLPKPLEKPAAERIKRVIGFGETRKELGKWNGIISRNRTAEHLSFPLNHAGKMKNSPTMEFLKRFRFKSDLMKKLEEVDPSVKFPMVEEEEEKDDKSKYTMEEMILKRKEAARLRALQSYKEAKAHRERKIKSKKYHRIQKKDKVKQQLKEFEELQENNPQEALAKLEQLDKTRAEERMSLRHKSTGQWAKNKQIKAKYDKDTRQVLAEQLAISRELTQKVTRMGDSDVEDEENQAPSVLSEEDKEDQWMNNVKTESEINEFIQDYRNYWDERNQEDKEKKAIKPESESDSARKRTSENKSEEENFNEASKGDNSTNQKAEESEAKEESKNLLNSASQKTAKSIKVNKENKKQNTRCTIISEEVLLQKKVKLCKNEISNTLQVNRKDTKHKNSHNDACGTSAWVVEEIQSDKEIKDEQRNKKSQMRKLQSVDEMFDSLEENTQRKVDLKFQKAKKKLEINSKKKQEKAKKQRKKKKKEEDNEDDESIPDLEFKNFKPKPILDQPLNETTSTENVQKNDTTSLKKAANRDQELPASESNNRETKVYVDKYPNIKPVYLETQLPDVMDEGEDALDNSEQEVEKDRVMSEAFADEDADEEFRKEKEEEIKNSRPENVDQRLPGWGIWSGSDIKTSKKNRRKKQTVLFNVPKEAPRKDENKGKVIIFEDQNKKLKEHLVSELPHPFTTVKDFEASLRAPVSRTFVPENAHLRLIQSAVNTKIGQVIEPMDENVLVKKQPTVKKSQKRAIDEKSRDKRSTAKSNKKRRK